MQGIGYRQQSEANSSAGLGAQAPQGSQEQRRHPIHTETPEPGPWGRGHES